MTYLDIIGSRMPRGFRFTFETFDYGRAGAICVEKNRRYAVRFLRRSNWSLKHRIALREAVEECKRVACRRYVPKLSSRWAP